MLWIWVEGWIAFSTFMYRLSLYLFFLSYKKEGVCLVWRLVFQLVNLVHKGDLPCTPIAVLGGGGGGKTRGKECLSLSAFIVVVEKDVKGYL